MSNNMVFVLGAGFSRAFVPKSPLLIDDFGVQQLRENFKSFSFSTAILDDALTEYTNGYVNLERLMTRLSGMPYDSVESYSELKLLEKSLLKCLVERLEKAKREKVEWELLDTFARLVRKNNASVVTFNYDDVLDEALWKDAQNVSEIDEQAWHPDGGYGFYCRPSSVCVVDVQMFMNKTRSLILKLHGSINWRSRLGEGKSRGPSAILHHEDWYKERALFNQPTDLIESHLEPDPFIIPPVLVKTELALHPVLNAIWKLAYERLANAQKVVFIGYSLPETDLASRTLFRETIARTNCEVKVVDFATKEDEEKRKRIKNVFQTLFPKLREEHFDFRGAKEWVENQIIGINTP